MNFLIAVSLDIGLKESIKHILMCDLPKCSPKRFYLFTLSAVVDGAFLFPHSYKNNLVLTDIHILDHLMATF